MSRILKRLARGLILLWAGQMMAYATEPQSGSAVIVADSRKFSGWQAWWANLYNENHLLFAVTTIIVIPVCGVILGMVADLVMSRLGIDLRSRTLAEH
jgi:hypothetical protein